MTISVVIATYNRASRLATCLERMERQRFVGGDEIVVANNGSTDRTAGVLLEASSRLPNLRVVDEPRPGKSLAVARALCGCRADVLAFTDDDVLVEDDWLAAIRAAMADPEVGLVGGPVLPLYEGRVPDWLDLEGDSGFGRLAAPLALLHYGPTRSPLGQRVALGANMAVRRDVFEGVGGFPADLGKLRGTLLSGEDHEVCERVQAAGFAAVYDPSIRVRHFVPADRLRVRYFLRWFFWSGVTNAALDRARPAHDPGRRLLGAPAYILRQLGVASAATAGSLLRASWSGAADHATRAAFAAGYVWASWKVRFGRRPVSAARRPMEAA